jgi:hypothetical protein
MAREPATIPEAPAPSPGRAFLARYGRPLTYIAVAAGLLLAILLIRSYWMSVQTGQGAQELRQVLTFPLETRLQHLERLAGRYAGSATAPEIRYWLGCAYRDTGRLEQAETTLRQLQQDAPGNPWSAMASEICRQIARARQSDATVEERIRGLQADSRAQRVFWGSEDGTDARDARLPVPHRPSDAAPAPEGDPRRGSVLDKP